MQSQFQDRRGGIAHQFNGPLREKAPDQAEHLMRPHPHRLVPLAQPFTHLGGRRKDTQER
jgi:hypothetical protein